jgi:hypothetical protein
MSRNAEQCLIDAVTPDKWKSGQRHLSRSSTYRDLEKMQIQPCMEINVCYVLAAPF